MTPTPPDGAPAPDQQAFTVEIPPHQEITPVSVPLTLFLASYAATPEKSSLIRQALVRVFDGFRRGDQAFVFEDLNTHMAYKALEISLDKMLMRATEKLTGSAPELPAEVPDDLTESPYPPEVYGRLMGSSAEVIDLEILHQWITDLQEMATFQSAASKVLLEADAVSGNAINELRTQVESQAQTIKELRKQTGGPALPKASLTMDIEVNIGLTGRFGSGIDVVSTALIEFRDSRRNLFEDQLKQTEYESAYNFLDDSQTAQNILDEMHRAAAELARSNYQAAEYKGRDAQYRDAINCEPKFHRKCLAEFMDTYAPGGKTDLESLEEEPAANDRV